MLGAVPKARRFFSETRERFNCKERKNIFESYAQLLLPSSIPPAGAGRKTRLREVCALKPKTLWNLNLKILLYFLRSLRLNCYFYGELK
jgi:hypothetical protein